MTDPKDMATLAAKIAQVAGSIGAIEKSGRNAFHKYDYHTEGDITAALRGKLADAKLALIWSHQVVDTSEGKDARGKLVRRVRVEGELMLVCGDTGAMLTVKSAGEGEDGGDKAVYKANTGAYKYALMKTFMISDAESDPERSTVDGERTGPRSNGKPARRPEQRQKQASKAPDWGHASQAFARLCEDSGLTAEQISSVRLHFQFEFGVEQWKDVPAAKLDALVRKMQSVEPDKRREKLAKLAV